MMLGKEDTMAYMTTGPALPGWTYREIRMIVAGYYPFIGPSPSCIENAYQYALSQMDWQATAAGANAVINVRTVKADQYYVLITGTAVYVDAQLQEMPSWAQQQEERSPWPTNMWDFVRQWTRDL
jgi:uncharacterized protein YbjQ (UPF0145 family)